MIGSLVRKFPVDSLCHSVITSFSLIDYFTINTLIGRKNFLSTALFLHDILFIVYIPTILDFEPLKNGVRESRLVGGYHANYTSHL